MARKPEPHNYDPYLLRISSTSKSPPTKDYVDDQLKMMAERKHHFTFLFQIPEEHRVEFLYIKQTDRMLSN